MLHSEEMCKLQSLLERKINNESLITVNLLCALQKKRNMRETD